MSKCMKRICSVTLVVAMVVSLSGLFVLPIKAASKPKLEKSKIEMYVGSTETIKLMSGSVKKMKSSNSKIVKVSGNTIIGKKAGKATVTVYDYNNKSVKCKVTVYSSKGIIKTQRFSYKTDAGEVVYYKWTNTSGRDIGIKVNTTEKDAKGKKQTWSGVYAYIKNGGSYLIGLVYPGSVSATFKFEPFVSPEKGCDDITCEVRTSDNKMLINLKNDGDKGADGVINIYGYDDSGNIVYLYSMTKYVDKKDTFEELFDLPVGEDGQKIIPVRYETEVMSFIQDY